MFSIFVGQLRYPVQKMTKSQRKLQTEGKKSHEFKNRIAGSTNIYHRHQKFNKGFQTHESD